MKLKIKIAIRLFLTHPKNIYSIYFINEKSLNLLRNENGNV